ncbi:arginine--tRNA ligase [Paractinoplanes lichenicola]|uniref:Arginine--tRNA ligase n=1 Tax=Paractinoplanes lichenicola TaxID=2802976 RepID=A0ABS1VNW8_9ACTN|nr:arginine--tRNA ligase [Actinoplanes lichenicola]MBL7256288.1 arginine--tRNA ligase [Actinoplanes lichenicola]
MNLEALLAARLAVAFEAVAGEPVDPLVRVSQHADFQSGAALALARRLGRAPREVAAEVLARSDLAGLATAEISGPGFLNLTVDDAVLAAPHPLDPPPGAKERIVLDYSGPNVAKELHVGHLRSTIIGDALARLFTWAGHDVVRVNHLGDWGTQFGMLIEQMSDLDGSYSLSDLTAFYRRARVRFDSDPDFRTRARLRVVSLQNGDATTRAMWHKLVEQSERSFVADYERLGITLTMADFSGESSYQDQLASVVDELTAKGLLVESEGALCAFPAGFTGRDGEPLPLIVRKSDGGFGYAATDLAALRHRTRDLAATRLLYVVGTPQSNHFAMVFAVGRDAGWLPGGVTAEHVNFGSVLGPDGKMLKTRSGDTIKLADLLDEADERATSPAVGIGAVKYADLANDRRSDYVFDWDRMLAATGNTGPYLQYALARIRSLLAKAAHEPGPVVLADPAERRLALTLLAFEPAAAAAIEHREPHRLAVHLHELAVAFTTFYEKCRPILGSPSRLALTARTGETLRLGLDLLGLPVPDEM